ncbi:hypothetical protein BB560_001886 [Smittium megazygosporum]|uniref:Vesicular-fusion protein SEC17 n=1 Tax=Smittium megazygosporum TaxID=133381 RepID=A0A2T9ZGA5_9FUNG|nr:hypothetical protein BB560_001886 [Smittium megazygosporum]
MAESEARKLLAKADQKAQHKGWFGSRKFDEAAELYEGAANQFKVAKCWEDAGKAFLSAAEMYMKLEELDDASNAYISASKSFKKNNAEASIDSLKKAIQILIQRGRFHSAAGHMKSIALTYETELSDLENSMSSYEQAAEWYSAEDSNAIANGCLLKVATFAAQLKNYEKAIEIFESIASASIDNQMSKWSVKDYFFKAGLCYFAANDVIGAQKAVERYKQLDSTFSSTRECKLLSSLIDDINNEDIDGFTNHVAEFDSISQLDSWKTSLLLAAKNLISVNEDSLT